MEQQINYYSIFFTLSSVFSLFYIIKKFSFHFSVIYMLTFEKRTSSIIKEFSLFIAWLILNWICLIISKYIIQYFDTLIHFSIIHIVILWTTLIILKKGFDRVLYQYAINYKNKNQDILDDPNL